MTLENAENFRPSLPKDVVIYVRFSTDMQNPQSSADQERVIRQQLSLRGIDHKNAMVISDDGISGTRTDRPGYQRVLRLIRERRIGVLAVDELSRLTRGHDALQVIQNVIFQQGRFLAFGENIDSAVPGWEMMTAFKQVSNNATIGETARRVRRGKEGRVIEGFSAGDFPFGYESDFFEKNALEIFGRGQKPKKVIRIKESEASIVREAFDRYAKGESINQIARSFALRNLPRGNRVDDTNWSHQQIARMLENRKYTGVWEYGLSTTIRNADGKKKQIPTDPKSHIRINRPELRIIDDATFEKVQLQRKSTKEKFGERFGQKKRGPKVHHTSVYPSSMLGGLVHCTCGARMYQVGHEGLKYFACPIAKRRNHRCKMHSHVPIELATQRVLEVVIDELRNQPEFQEKIFDEMKAHLEKSYAATPSDLERIEASIAGKKRARTKLTQSIEKDDSAEVETIVDRIKELTVEIKNLEKERADADSRQDTMDRFPTLEWFQEKLRDSAKLFESEAPESMLLLRTLISRIEAEQVIGVGKKRGFTRLKFDFNGYAAFAITLEQRDGGYLAESQVDAQTFEGIASKSFTIDLGKPTKADEWSPRVFQMREAGMKWAEIEKVSGIGVGNLYNYYMRYKSAVADMATADAAVALVEIDSNAIDDAERHDDQARPNKPR